MCECAVLCTSAILSLSVTSSSSSSSSPSPFCSACLARYPQSVACKYYLGKVCLFRFRLIESYVFRAINKTNTIDMLTRRRHKQHQQPVSVCLSTCVFFSASFSRARSCFRGLNRSSFTGSICARCQSDADPSNHHRLLFFHLHHLSSRLFCLDDSLLFLHYCQLVHLPWRPFLLWVSRRVIVHIVLPFDW